MVLNANARTPTGMALGVRMYLLRAIGDTGAEALSRLYPIGLVLRTQVFVVNQTSPQRRKGLCLHAAISAPGRSAAGACPPRG